MGLPVGGFGAVAPEPSGIRPLTRAHAHNDYEHTRPLLDALDQGFCSIEADIYLVDGQLLVAHERSQVQPGRTLAALYLEPLRQRIRANGGRVYRGGPTVVLLVDVKTDAQATYGVLHETLKSFSEILTVFREGRVDAGAVTVIVSGNRARDIVVAQTVRFAALDGRKKDLGSSVSPLLVPWVSEDWNAIFPWRWEGPMPDETRTLLRQWIAKAHAGGQQVRFWNTPDRPEAWRVLFEAGVDWIGTDDLSGLKDFLRARPVPAGAR
ncbi:MAG: hypothetical protein EXS38_09900 [Opitutus sp.]|nr:hypothetical protein [Opitutus sp.]